jgi:phosphatidylinositol alpha-1,6-mannosyltransferase
MTLPARRTSPEKKLRIAYLLPLVRRRSGWLSFAQGAIRSLAEWVEPVLIVGKDDLSAAKAEFPERECHVLPTVQAEDWNETTLSMLRQMIPARLAARRLPALSVDLIHSLEMFPAGWLGDLLARRNRVPHVLTAHGTYSVIWNRWPVLDHFYRGVLTRASAVYPISRGTAEKLAAAYGAILASGRIHIVGNGTDVASRVDRTAAIRRIWPDSPVVLSVGGVKSRKGFHTSLRAFALLQRRFPDARYRIVGRLPDTAYVRRLEEIIRSEDIRNVDFLGVVDSTTLESEYGDASVFLLLSEEERGAFEGFGLVYLEAGAWGLPVVASRSGGIPDAVVDGKSGFLVPPGDADAAAQALIRLVCDKDLSARMGAAGRTQAESLTWRRFAVEQHRQYQALLRQRSW